MHRKMLTVAIAIMLIASMLPLATAFANPGDPVLDSLNAIDFSSREEFVSFFSMDVDPREVATCPLEFACVRVLREKDANDFIRPFQMTNPTTTTFDGWRAFGQANGQAKVPPGTWMVEGITVRGFGHTPGGAPSTTVSTTPTVANGNYTVQPGDTLSAIASIFDTTVSAIVSANGISNPNLIVVGQVLTIPGNSSMSSTPTSSPASSSSNSLADADSTRATFGIDSSVSVTACDGEPNCFAAIKRDSAGNPQPFHLSNPTGHKLDGQLANGNVGIPAGFDGQVMGATLRP